MPNHVRNMLTIIGPARDVATFVMHSQAPRPRSGDQPFYDDGRRNLNFTTKPAIAQPFDFHGVVPLPPEYSRVPYSSDDPRNGYEIEWETWGCKWGPYDMNPAEDIQIAEHSATFAFTIAWGIPARYYEEASRRFPTCLFAVSWGGEGPCLGRGLWQVGVQTFLEEKTHADVPAYEEADDGAAYEAAERQYLETHEAWTRTLMDSPATAPSRS